MAQKLEQQSRGCNGQCYDSRAIPLHGDFEGMYQPALCDHVGALGGLICLLTNDKLTRTENATPPGTAVDIWIDRPATCPFPDSQATPLDWPAKEGRKSQ